MRIVHPRSSVGDYVKRNVVIQGGLGNQLSQWAFAHSFSDRKSFCIDPINGLGLSRDRGFELLPVINLCPHIHRNARDSLVIPWTTPVFHALDRLWQFSSLRKLIERLGYVREDPRIDQEQTTKFPKVIRYAKGYFQKQQAIENNFAFVEREIIPVVGEYLPKLRAKFSLLEDYSVMHVRRGDYKSAEFSTAIIGTLSDKYFVMGCSKFKSKKLVLLTENRRDVIDLVKTLTPDLVLDKHDTSAWETLAIMYGATNLLGSNSSLSWWGAKLCSFRGGDVWLPAQWSYWRNIDPSNYHFPLCKTVEAHWA